MLLKDKVAVITGGGRGIGREIALAYAKAGADVILAARSVEALERTKADIEEAGRRVLVVQTDIRQPDSLQNLAEQVLNHFGQVDVLVNNSGIGGPSAPLWEIDLADWEEVFDVNVKGTYLCCKAFLPAMIERGSGSIIIISSMTGKRPLLNRTPYASSKLALVGLTRTLAWETGPYGIRVNVISPGAVEGERIEWVIQKQAESQGITVEEARRQFTGASPLDKLTSPVDIANAAIFLASDMATSVTGEDMNVSAGLVMY